jgi:hypothetical protein
MKNEYIPQRGIVVSWSKLFGIVVQLFILRCVSYNIFIYDMVLLVSICVDNILLKMVVLTETCKAWKIKNTTFINHTGRWLKNFMYNLNCLMMIDTFSDLWTSLCGRRWQWEMTRNIALSNNSNSSATVMLANWFRLWSSSSTFGISLYTIEN